MTRLNQIRTGILLSMRIAGACLFTIGGHGAAYAMELPPANEDSGTTRYSQCRILEINFINSTNTSCTLIRYRKWHGLLLSSPPPTTLDTQLYWWGNKPSFRVRQLAFGPEVNVVYNCGGRSVTLKAQQDFCFSTPAKIHASWTSDSLDVSQDVQSATFYEPGKVWWTLLPKKTF